jgi:hypothetical protein
MTSHEEPHRVSTSIDPPGFFYPITGFSNTNGKILSDTGFLKKNTRGLETRLSSQGQPRRVKRRE